MIEDLPQNDLLLEIIGRLFVTCVVLLTSYILYSEISHQRLITKKEIYDYLKDKLSDPITEEEIILEIIETDIDNLTIRELREIDDLSLSYRFIPIIPLSFINSQGIESIKKLDLTECSLK